jgi:hypothetical protein
MAASRFWLPDQPPRAAAHKRPGRRVLALHNICTTPKTELGPLPEHRDTLWTPGALGAHDQTYLFVLSQ